MIRCPRSALGLCAGLVACLPEPEPVRWQALEIEALRQAIATPTGVVDQDSTTEVAAEIVEDREAYRAVANFIDRAYTSAGAGAPLWIYPQQLEGTSVYALVACPGEDPLATGLDFGHGHMRVDSTDLSLEIIEDAKVSGDLRLSFVACRIGDFTIDGEIAAHYDRDAGEIGAAPDLHYADEREGDAGTVVHPMLNTLGTQTSVLFTLDSGDTLVLEWAPLELELRLRGSNGIFVCEIAVRDGDDDILGCTPP